MTDYYRNAGWNEAARLRKEIAQLRFYVVVILVSALVVVPTLCLLLMELNRRARTSAVLNSLTPTVEGSTAPANNDAAGARRERCTGLCVQATPRKTLPCPATWTQTRAAPAAVKPARVRSPLQCRKATTSCITVGTNRENDARGDIYQQAVDYIWWRESRNGTDPRAKRGMVGPAGERGDYQITPIFLRDIRRLFGVKLDAYDNNSCRIYIAKWLAHYGPKATSIDELYQCYNSGP